MNWEYFNQILASRNSGHVEESIVELEKLISDDEDKPTNAAILMEIVNGLRILGRYSEAYLKIDQACILLGPENEYYPRAAFLGATLDMDTKNWKRALATLDDIIERYGHAFDSVADKDFLHEVHQNRGMALAELKRFREARDVLETVRSPQAGNGAFLCYLGICNYELKDFDAAKRDFEELLLLNPSSIYQAYAHYHVGRIWYQREQYARAKAEFEKCLACPDRGKISDEVLLQGLIYSCQALKLDKDADRYTKMHKEQRCAHRQLQ